jgi:hypothetical protein
MRITPLTEFAYLTRGSIRNHGFETLRVRIRPTFVIEDTAEPGRGDPERKLNRRHKMAIEWGGRTVENPAGQPTADSAPSNRPARRMSRQGVRLGARRPRRVAPTSAS